MKFSRENDIAVIPYSTLAQGLLTGKYKKGATFTDGRSVPRCSSRRTTTEPWR